MKNKIILLITALCLSSVTIVTVATKAYNLDNQYKLGSPSNTTYVIKHGTPYTPTMGWKNAINDWNASQNKVTMKHSSSSKNVLTTMNHAQKSYFGEMLIYYNASSKVVTSSEGRLNLNADYMGQKMSNINVATSTASHELGHLMGLDHVGGTAIMNTGRNRNNITTPQTDDINGIKAKY